MGKNKKKPEKEGLTKPAPAAEPAQTPEPDRQPPAPVPAPAAPVPEAAPEHLPPAPATPKSRWRRLAPDLLKVALALAVIGIAAAIWYKPPLVVADFPHLSYLYQGKRLTDATLYRPLAMPTRYYIALARPLAGRYAWFAVDRRREVVALAEEPGHRFLGRKAIKRSDPLGLDLEFRKLDGSEWQVHFFADAIVFSNAVLSVRLDAKHNNSNGGK